MASRNQRGWVVPGFHLPLKWQQEGESGRDIHRSFLNSALDGSENGGDGFQPLTVEERLMLSIMNEFTDDPAWDQSIKDVAFLEAWKNRNSAHGRLSRQMVDWCAQEIHHRATQFQLTGFLPALDHGVYKSDAIVEPTLAEALQNSLRRLERFSTYGSHHGPQPKVIVDPCLYPFRFGVSKYYSSPMSSSQKSIRLSGKGMSRNLLSRNSNSTLDERNSYKIDKAFSLRYQWLPCDIGFDEETGKARIKSYINNVHPILDHDVYAVANDLLSAFIPMLNSSLMHVKTSNLFYPRIDPEKQISREGLPDPEPGPYRSSESRLRSGKLTEDGKLPTPVRVDLRKEFWDNGIQAVIQVSSIELGEDRPAYPGEDWHVQGQLNERICATVMYCYSCDNVSDASISFRHRCSSEDLMSLNTLTSTTKATENVYGVEDLQPAVQEHGSVVIREGRVISFPNVFQTRINAVKLRERGKAGHLKMFIVHLIDPNRRIMSTSMVLCQRRDWWAREIRQKVPMLRRLPVEIFDNIVDMVDGFPVSSSDAEKMREEMLEERAEL
ncbi:MAG: hypothetical protein LQ337_001525 [Flavoplaca oasis]|nr:MAG: hypothetical protein LQ337_001525 [Flavoplaca oasis]